MPLLSLNLIWGTPWIPNAGYLPFSTPSTSQLLPKNNCFCRGLQQVAHLTPGSQIGCSTPCTVPPLLARSVDASCNVATVQEDCTAIVARVQCGAVQMTHAPHLYIASRTCWLLHIATLHVAQVHITTVHIRQAVRYLHARTMFKCTLPPCSSRTLPTASSPAPNLCHGFPGPHLRRDPFRSKL